MVHNQSIDFPMEPHVSHGPFCRTAVAHVFVWSSMMTAKNDENQAGFFTQLPLLTEFLTVVALVNRFYLVELVHELSVRGGGPRFDAEQSILNIFFIPAAIVRA